MKLKTNDDPSVLTYKYYFKYEGSVANVYYKSVWGNRLVASFRHGLDAKEYVNWKNLQTNG